MKWINSRAHKVVIDSLYYGEIRTEAIISERLLELYLDAHYDTLGPEFFYNLYNTLLDVEGYNGTIEWSI